MSKRVLFLLFLAVPVFARAQEPATAPAWSAPNALTMQLLLQQRPADIPAEQWQRMVLSPVHASLYPIRVTQAMLDTMDARQLDLRYRYVMEEKQRGAMERE